MDHLKNDSVIQAIDFPPYLPFNKSHDDNEDLDDNDFLFVDKRVDHILKGMIQVIAPGEGKKPVSMNE